MKHATRLLGEDVVVTWQDALSKISAHMRQYFKTKSLQTQSTKAHHNFSELPELPASKNEKIAARSLQLLQEAKEASKTQGSEVPKSTVIFLLINVYMQEDENLLIKVIEDSASDEDVKKQAAAYPNLVIRGTSLYDPNALYSAVLENKVIIKVKDILQGISVSFLCYYVFGYAYPLPLSKSL